MKFVNPFDVGSAHIGTIIGWDEKPGRTGYQVSMYLRGEERTMDVTKEAYQLRWTTEYFPYPVLGEIMFMAKFDENGIVNEFVNVNYIAKEGNPIRTGLVMGTCRMFKKKILEDTPALGDIISIEGNTVTFKNFDALISNGEIAHCVYGGAMDAPRDGGTFQLAEDVNIHVWDWSTATVPFQRCTREEAEEYGFVERFSLGTKADLLKNCYFVNFYSTRGNEEEIDFVKCFLNKAPGWTE